MKNNIESIQNPEELIPVTDQAMSLAPKPPLELVVDSIQVTKVVSGLNCLDYMLGKESSKGHFVMMHDQEQKHYESLRAEQKPTDK